MQDLSSSARKTTDGCLPSTYQIHDLLIKASITDQTREHESNFGLYGESLNLKFLEIKRPKKHSVKENGVVKGDI